MLIFTLIYKVYGQKWGQNYKKNPLLTRVVADFLMICFKFADSSCHLQYVRITEVTLFLNRAGHTELQNVAAVEYLFGKILDVLGCDLVN